MTVRALLWVSVILVATCAGAAVGQQKLGDLVSQGGYDWMIGKWAATTDDGSTIHLEYGWALDKYAMTVDLRMGDFKYYGLIMYVSSKDEIAQSGIDNRGGIWEGMWYEDYAGAVYKVTHTQPDGETNKAEIVHSPAGADGMKVVTYGLDDSGNRNSEPWVELTYKRQAKSAGSTSSAGSSSADHETLGDLLAQYGYDWIIGQWQAKDDNGQDFKLNWKWVLDKNGILVELKTDAFSYLGMVAYNASAQEVIQFGADTMGRTMKGTWGEDDQGAALRSEILIPYEQSQKIEHVFSKIDNDSFKVQEYEVGSDGWRASSPRGEVTFKRQK